MNDDWELLDRASRRDEGAWRQLSDHYRPRLLGLAYLITGSRAIAEDIAQEAFVVLLQRPPKRSAETLMPFLSTVAYNLALKEKYRYQRYSDIDGLEIEDDTPGQLELLARQEEQFAVTMAISRLRPEHREIIALRFQGDLSYEKIADLLGIPLGTVKSRIFNAVKQCRTTLVNRNSN